MVREAEPPVPGQAFGWGACSARVFFVASQSQLLRSRLTTIAQRRAIDGLRRAARTRTREVHAPLAYVNHPDSSGHPEETASQNDQTKVLNFALGKLSVRQREAVEHLALQSRSLAQTATVTGRSTGSLRLDWHRALKTLRAQFGGKG